MPITYLDEEEEDFASPLRPTPLTQPKRRKITYFDEGPAERKAGLLPPVEEMFKPKPKEVGTFEGIANAARNAFASSQQALSVTGGVTPEEAKEISKIEFEKNARQVSPDYKEYQEAQGFDAVKAFARNPFEVTTNIVAEGLAGSLPALGAGLAAGGVGAAVAAPTVVGAPVGFLAGQVAGTFAGSLATEYGSKVLEELQGAGMDINNPDSITDFFSRQELVDAAKDKALKRGVPIAAFDALSAGIGGKVGAITKAAFKTKPREAVAEMAVQAALGGGGEVVGSLAAGDKIDPKAVFAEVVGEVGPGAAEIGVGKIQQTFAERRKQEQIKRAAKVSQDLENNNAPLTADALKTTVAKNAVEEEKATIEETDTALTEEAAKFAPPEDAITKQELKTQYSALSPEDLTDTEATFRERLNDEDTEMRAFAQNALDAIAEVRAEQARARKLPTDVLPTETPGATYGREADIYDVFADIRRRPMPPSGPAFESAQVIEEAARRADVLRRTPEGRELLRRELQGEEMVGGVRRATEEALATAPEPAEGDVFAEIRRPSRAEEAAITIEQQLAEDERIRRSQLGAEALREELAQVESLSRVADNTATDEEVVRLARQGLVNIQEGQNVITPRGEEVMQRGGAPLPRLTPEERAAEVAAAPAAAKIAEMTPEDRSNLATNIKRFGWNPEDYGMTQSDVDAYARAEKKQQKPEDISFKGGKIVRYTLDSGKGLLNRSSYDLNKLTEDEDAELTDYLAVGLAQPINVEGGIFYFSESGEKQHARLIELLSKSAKGNVVRTELTTSEKPIWESSDGQLAFAEAPTVTPAPVSEAPAPTPVTTPPVTEAVTPAPAAPAPAITPAPVAETPAVTGAIVSPEQYVPSKNVRGGTTKQPLFTSLILQDGTAIVGESAHPLAWNRAIELGITTEDQLANSTSAFTRPDGFTETINGNQIPIKKIVWMDQFADIQTAASQNNPINAAAVDTYNITLPEGYTKQGELYVYQPAVSETITPAAEPAGISVGNRVKTKTTPQSFVVEEVLPQSAREAELGEQYYSIRNERTGEVQAVEAGDIKIVRGKGVRKLFAGEKAEMPKFRRDSLDAARAMAVTGKTPEEIRAVTGWFQGRYDGKMRWEIPDQNAKLTTEAFLKGQGEPSFESLINKYYNVLKNQGTTIIGKLSDILDHKELYDLYPDLKNIEVVIAPLKGKATATFIESKPQTETSFGNPDTIELNARNFPKDLRSTILHEIQHAIQKREGFARGASSETSRNTEDTRLAAEMALGIKMWMKDPASKNLSIEEIQRTTSNPNRKDLWPLARELVSKSDKELKKLTSSKKLGFEGYKKVAGEIEARDIQTRRDFTQEQLFAIAPYSSENIAPEEAIILTGSVDASSEVRAEEKYTPVPEADRYTFREASGRAIRFFGGEKPENFVIVNNSTDPDYEFKAGYDPDTGEIILNRAYIQRGENIEDILTHELGHYIYSDPQFQADFQDFLESMPDEARAEIDRIVNEGYNKETNEVQIEEREVMAFTSLIRRTKRGLTAWEKLKDTIKKIINRFLGTNITLSDQGAMAVFNVGYKRFKSGERIIREMKKGTLRTAPEGMTQMDRDYLAAVERGDMETAQRMVDEAAKKAGYETGFYHGTDKDFTAFKAGSMVTQDPEYAVQFGRGKNGKVMPVAVAGIDTATPLGMFEYQDLKPYIESGEMGGVYKLGNSYVMAEPEMIKSADPVTYDDAGNVIPLSQRFRPTSPDIRRMAPEPAPATEAVVEEAPAERPKRRTKMQNIIDISTGVKRPKTKLTVNEMTALKDQIKLGARKRKEDKRTQREFAKDLTQQLREAAIRGKVRPSQLRAITSKALQTQFDNDASILGFVNYANKVIENANYEKDLSDAKAAIKSAKNLAKQKKLPANVKKTLLALADINPKEIDDPGEFATIVNEYTKGAGPVTARGYIVIPDEEMIDYLQMLGDQIEVNRKNSESDFFPEDMLDLVDKSAVETNEILNKDQERKAKLEAKVTSMAESAQIGLAKYENPEMTSEEKSILDDMKRIDLANIDIGNRKEFIRVANNILVNNKFFGAGRFASIAKGQNGAMMAAEDSKTIKRNDAMFTFLEDYISEKLTRTLNLSVQSVADAFRNIAGKEGAPRLQFQMGIGDLARGQAIANKLNDEIANGIRDKYTLIEKETGQSISDKQGMFSMGVAANLIQIQADETEAEGISRMRKLILEDIAVRENSPSREDRRNVEFVKKALEEVDADTVEGILENLRRLHPANYKALDFLMNTVLPEHKDALKEHDELFNNQSDNYTNPFYLPIRYRKTMVPVRTPEDIITSIYEGLPKPKQAPNTIKRQKYSTLPRDNDGAPMLFDFNLTKNVLDSLSSQITATYTNPAWQQMVSFLKSPAAIDAVGGTTNLSFLNERLGKLAQSRTRRAYEMDGISRVLDSVANATRRLGIGLALGGYGQFIKQMPDQMMTTLANVKDANLIAQSMSDLVAGKANAVLQQFSIGERGEIAGGTKWINQMEGNFGKVRKFMEEGKWAQFSDAFERLNNIWLFALKKSDYLAAGSGWLSYYRKHLRDKGIEFNNWDDEAKFLQENDQSRIEAALYAEQMVDMYQGSSDPTKMASLSQRGQNGWENLVKTIFIPFFSFVIQQRSRIFSDARDIAFGDSDQKKSGASGLAGSLVGILGFHIARRFALPAIAGVGASAIYALLGVDMDEPDEEKQKEEANKIWRQFSGEVLSNIVVGGFGDFTEKKFIDSVNYAFYLIEAQLDNENVLDDNGEIISFEKYQKERSPLYRYTGPGSENNLGMLDIMPGQLGELKDRMMQLSDEELAESLTPEERRVLFVAGLSEWLYTMRLNDADIARMIRRMNKDVIEQAEGREKALKRLQEIYK